jgi:hypothetical protein
MRFESSAPPPRWSPPLRVDRGHSWRTELERFVSAVGGVNPEIWAEDHTEDDP